MANPSKDDKKAAFIRANIFCHGIWVCLQFQGINPHLNPCLLQGRGFRLSPQRPKVFYRRWWDDGMPSTREVLHVCIFKIFDFQVRFHTYTCLHDPGAQKDVWKYWWNILQIATVENKKKQRPCGDQTPWNSEKGRKSRFGRDPQRPGLPASKQRVAVRSSRMSCIW